MSDEALSPSLVSIATSLAPPLCAPSSAPPPPPLSGSDHTTLLSLASPLLSSDPSLLSLLRSLPSSPSADSSPLRAFVSACDSFGPDLLSLLLLLFSHSPSSGSTAFNISSLLASLSLPAPAAAFALHHLFRRPDDEAALYLFSSCFARSAPSETVSALSAFVSHLSTSGSHPASLASANHTLSLLGAGPNGSAGDAAYVAQRFDRLAGVFESRLVGQLGYRVPGDLARMLGKGGGRCVDLGCGTGLFGKACGELGLEWGELLGCDLSGEMCALARGTGLYGRVEQEDVTEFLAGLEDGTVDAVVSADTYIYVGALEAHALAVLAALSPPGLWAFSVEEGAAAEAARVALLMSGRYAHGAAYVRGLVRGAGMEVREERATVVRKEAGEDVPGRLYVCGRQGGGEGGGENDNLNL
ncbi:hypothetical protein TeGR_g752 [Tetraparma gracilis]|uniref:Methyltransferase domain-containing protein n=1 Tax=Tetraparma gracilis TaxID=2962635 RepID=A0ABQ6MGH4_9STRA|nr:hypothetical protein TeGR_g752 [Tetraparma gracilis]